jgi:hypothetical protein
VTENYIYKLKSGSKSGCDNKTSFRLSAYPEIILIWLILLACTYSASGNTYYLTSVGSGSAQSFSSWNTSPTGNGTAATTFAMNYGTIGIKIRIYTPSGLTGTLIENDSLYNPNMQRK